MGDAVARHNRSRPVRPPPAVNEYRAEGLVVEQHQQMRNLVIRRSRIAAQGNIDVAHAGGLDDLLLGLGPASALAQVDDGFDAKMRQILETLAGRLRTAVNGLVELMEIPDAGAILGLSGCHSGED